MAANIESLLARFRIARNERMLFRGLFEDAYKFSMPNRNLFEDETAGAEKNSDVFDTTLGHATNIFVSKLINGLTPPFQRWAKLVAGEDVPLQLKNKINTQLEEATDLLFRFIHRSNFALAIGQAYFDLAIGTMALLENPGPNDKNPLVFNAVDLMFLAPEEGPLGTIEGAWRELNEVTGRNVIEIWPRATLSNNLSEQLLTNPDGKFNFIEGSIPQDDKFLYIVIHAGTNEIILEEVSDSSPWVIARWKKLAIETFGRGPVIDALPSALTLNQIAEFELRAAALAVSPPYMAFSDSVFNPSLFRLEPNTIIPVNRSASPTWPLQRLEVGGNIQFTQLLVKDLRDQVNAFMFTKALGSVTDTPVRTATEVNLRNSELLEEVGPAIGRLEVELLGKIINRSIFLLKERGLFPDIEVDGKKITLSFESPLAKSQDAQDLNALAQTNEMIQSILQNPQALLAYNLPELPEFIAQKTGLNLSLVKNPQQMLATAQQVQQQQQQMQLQQQAQAQAAQSPQPPPQAPPQLPSPQGTTGLAA